MPAMRSARGLLGDLTPGLLFAAALALYIPSLEIPPQYIYDEVYHAYTAGEYVRGNADAYVWYTHAPRPGVAYMWNHPTLGVSLIAGGIFLYGNDPFGWRIASAIFGAAGIALAWFLALRLTRRRSVAILAAGLLLLDGLYFVQSRTGMLDIFLTVFLMAAMLSFHAYLTAPPDRRGRLVALTGMFLGLSLATKWSAAYPAALIGCVVLWRSLAPGPVETPGSLAWRRRAAGDLAWVVVGLGVVPAGVYLAAHIPFFAAGHTFAEFVELQRQIYYYHTHLHETHKYQSRWWEWPLTLRPVWYYVAYLGDRVANVYANGNPILNVAFVPAAAIATAVWWKRSGPAAWTLAIGFFGQWLPWALVARISFAYHFLPATPFGCIAVATGVAWLWRRRGYARIAAAAYVAVVAASFVFFYPIYTAVPLTHRALELRFWLPSWR
jgi:dolichyl-phosphate-mannose-protein mannosyltransferase